MRHWTRWALAATLASSALGTVSAAPQTRPGEVEKDLTLGPPPPITGVHGVAQTSAVVNFAELARREALAPPPPRNPTAIREGPAPPPKPVPAWARPSTQITPEAAPVAALPVPAPRVPVLAASFQAAPDNNVFIPPDTDGTVGPNHLMVALNGTVRIQSKSGGLISSMTLDGFWASVNGGSGAFDPKVLYDQMSGRWLFFACDDPEASTAGILIGASATNDPTGTWFLNKVASDSPGVLWDDFPSVGFNKDWVVFQVNMFTVPPDNFSHGDIYVFNKASLYAGGSAFTLFMDSNTFAAAPAVTFDSSLATMYLIEDWNGNSGGSGFLRLSSITGPVGSETFTANVGGSGFLISVAAPWADGPPVANWAPQSGSATGIEVNDSRIVDAVYRNGSLWTSHTVFLPATGSTRSSVQWWQINPTGPTVTQRGRLDDPTAVNFYGFPSIAVNFDNEALLGFSRFSSTTFASAYYAYRSPTDPANTFQADTLLKAGEATYFKDFGFGDNRWGDYSVTSIDPSNDGDFWTTQEYAASPANHWATWWGKITGNSLSSLSINDVSATEGNSGTKTFAFTVTLSPVSASTVTVNFATADGTATTSDSDYVATSGVLTFTAGQTTKTINVTVNGDTKFETDETFFVNLSSPTGASITKGQGQGTILNDDPMPSLSINDAMVLEGNSGTTPLIFTVSLSAVSGLTTTVNYATADGTAMVSDSDYVPASGMLTIPAGSVSATLTVSVIGDTKPELNETFFVNLSGPVNATINDGQGQGTILNDDGRPALCIPIASLPFTISVQGNYCLVQNLSTAQSTGNAITIMTDFVNLDLKGFKIGGGSAGFGTQANGVYGLNRKNVTIRNGNIRGFFRAVFLEDNSGTFTASQGHAILNLRTDENTYEGIHVQGRGTIVIGNQVVTTGGSTVFGANANAYGIHTEGAEVRVLNNDVTDTNPQGTGAGNAIAVEQATGAVVEKDRLANSTANNSYGVKAVSGSNVLVIGNRISGTAFGVFFGSASGSYRDNLTTGVVTPYTGGTNAGNNQ